MLIKKTFVLLLSFVSLSLFAQTYNGTEFITPPMKYRPVPLWFWNNDQVTEDKMLGEFDKIIDTDFYGGVAILPFGGNFRPTYLSQEYFDLYSKVIARARVTGAHMSVYDEYGFPSGSMGAINGDGVTRFMNNHPGKTIHRLDKYESAASGGKVFTRSINFNGKLMAVDAYNSTTKEVIALSEYIKDDVLTWNVPEGSWKIIFFTCVVDGDPNVDYLSPDAVKLFIEDTHEQYYKQFPEAFGETITSTFFDEPTMYRASGRMWTDDYNDKFQQRYGYSPEKLYPSLWYNIGTGTSAARNMLFGFRAQLYAEGFMKTLAEWAESHGILSTGHQDQEEILNTTSVSGDLMLDGKYMSMPGIDRIGGNRPTENFYKVVSSSANNWDHTLVMSETYGDMGNITTETMYRIATEQFTKGINYLIPHAVWYNNRQVSFLPELSYRNPLYNKELPRFNRFLSRLRYVLARPGQHVADIAVVYPIQTQQAGHYLDGSLGNMLGGVSVAGTDYNKISQILTDEIGRDFTYLHPEVIDDRCNVADGVLTMANPVNTEHFSVIILPGVKAISLSNMQKIEQAWLNGVTVIFTTQLPKESATMDVQNAEISSIVDRMLNTEKDKGNALFVPSPTATSLAIALASCKMTTDVQFEGSGQAYNYIHKVIEGNNVYYFGNIDQQTTNNVIRLKGHLAKASLMNPRTGEITDASLSYDGDCTVINMTLAPEESMLLIENGPAATTIDHDSYTIKMKFNIEKLSAGIVFAARNSKNFYLWQFNVEDAANPKLRPHVWFDGNVSLLGEIPLAQKVDLKAGTDYNLRIEVTDGSLAKTYINDVLVDKRYGQFSYGMVGFRQDHSDSAGTVETALFDDISVVDGNGNSVFADNFSSPNTYSSGTLTNGWLRVNGSMTGQVLSLPLRFSNADYTVESDVTLIKDDVAVVFASQNDDTYYMWALNCFDGALPRIRRHVYDGGNLTFSDTEFSQFTKSALLGSEHGIKIEVKSGTVKTYIDNVLVDTYADYSTNLIPGDIGFRIDASGPQRDEAYIDNVVVKTYDSTGNARTVLEDDFEQQNPSWFPNTETKSVEGNNKLWLHGSSLIKLMQSDKPVLSGITPTYSLRTDNGDTLYSTSGIMMTAEPQKGIYIKGDKKFVVDTK